MDRRQLAPQFHALACDQLSVDPEGRGAQIRVSEILGVRRSNYGDHVRGTRILTLAGILRWLDAWERNRPSWTQSIELVVSASGFRWVLGEVDRG